MGVVRYLGALLGGFIQMMIPGGLGNGLVGTESKSNTLEGYMGDVGMCWGVASRFYAWSSHDHFLSTPAIGPCLWLPPWGEILGKEGKEVLDLFLSQFGEHTGLYPSWEGRSAGLFEVGCHLLLGILGGEGR